jgi:catechol 1,2-dioxygenase
MSEVIPEGPAPDAARLHAIFDRTVASLKEIVREFQITEDELHLAGRYFNRLGQSGMSPSLIDVCLALTAVETAAGADQGTRANLEGPYHTAHPLRPDGVLLDRPPSPTAVPLSLTGVVRDTATGAPVGGALVDVWQADDQGLYDRQGLNLRGVVVTDQDGRYAIHTIVPSDYAEHDHDPIGELFRAMGKPNTRAAHIHLKISIGSEVELTTQVFMPDSLFLGRDYVEGAVTDDLVLRWRPVAGGTGYQADFDVFVRLPPGLAAP